MTTAEGSRDCTNCGAHLASLSARFCEYCGTELARPAAAVVVASAGRGDLAARFEELERHESYGRLMQLSPDLDLAPSSGIIVMILASTLIVGVSLAMSVFLFFICAPLALLPLVVAGIAATFMVQHMNDSAKIKNAPLRRLPALVADERTHVSGGSNSGASTRYYATLEFPDGRREEVYAQGKTAGEISPGDLGVAYLMDRLLVAFERVPV